MEKEKTIIGNAQEIYNVAGTKILKYTVEMFHEGLKEHKNISAPEYDMLQNKAGIQKHKWDEKWEIIESKRIISEDKNTKKEEAIRLTNQAIEDIHQIDNILNHTLSINDAVNWDELKKVDQFPNIKPSKPHKKKKVERPKEPTEAIPKFHIFEKIIPYFKKKKIKLIDEINEKRISEWESQLVKVGTKNQSQSQQFDKDLINWNLEVSEWELKKNEFIKEKELFNQTIDKLKDNYSNKKPDSIVEYCELVLNNSEYPDSFPSNFELEYNLSSKLLILEYELPSQKSLPKIKEVKYIISRNEHKEVSISEPQKNKTYDEAIYKIALRTLHELFEADVIDALDIISLNGWVNSINKSTGKRENNCILSIQAQKDEFNQIDLSNIEPKACFKNLKGVASSKLSSLTSIQPILQINKSDRRFVDRYDVTNQIDNSTNIAAMDWEDFEHLIGEIFEQEFKSNGGEVKVTQGSRDGGVDAIAFDPDPIRGGKIVIQAKRYTNTVGVAAVRDLYGTVLNEGATKGILVTTANYGPDAYAFAKDKPLTLLNGSNLLHLLKKHGHHAKIDLKEAKKILLDRENAKN